GPRRARAASRFRRNARHGHSPVRRRGTEIPAPSPRELDADLHQRRRVSRRAQRDFRRSLDHHSRLRAHSARTVRRSAARQMDRRAPGGADAPHFALFSFGLAASYRQYALSLRARRQCRGRDGITALPAFLSNLRRGLGRRLCLCRARDGHAARGRLRGDLRRLRRLSDALSARDDLRPRRDLSHPRPRLDVRRRMDRAADRSCALRRAGPCRLDRASWRHRRGAVAHADVPAPQPGAPPARARAAAAAVQRRGANRMTRADRPLQIGALIFEEVDQLDVTGPFEVLSHLPDTVFRLYGKTTTPARDVRGLRLLPDARLDDAPRLDVLVVPGGFGQEAVMEDEETLAWVQRQAGNATHVLSVCTGALILGAAGLLKGRRATTHWAVRHLLPCFGAVGVEERVVVDGKVTSTAGVTAGLDGALRLAAALRGEEAAQAIQLFMEYAPQPPFDCGTPKSASSDVVEGVRRQTQAITAQREATARRIAAKLG